MARRLFLHIGTMKSGTTYIQTVMEGGRDQLAARGLLWPAEAMRYTGVRQLLSRQTPRPAWREISRQLAEHPGDALFSNEMLAALRPRQIARLVRALPAEEVHILITARHLARVIPSHWQTQIKSGGRQSWAEFATLVCQDPPDPPESGGADEPEDRDAADPDAADQDARDQDDSVEDARDQDDSGEDARDQGDSDRDHGLDDLDDLDELDDADEPAAPGAADDDAAAAAELRAIRRRGSDRFWWRQDVPGLIERWSAVVPVERITVITVPLSARDPKILERRFTNVIGVELGDLRRPKNSNASVGAHSAELLRRLSIEHSGKDGKRRFEPRGHVTTALTNRAKKEPRFGLSPEQFAWVEKRSVDAAERIRESGAQVVGDLDELVDDVPPVDVVDPADSTDGELLAAACDGLVAAVAAVNELREQKVELERELRALANPPAGRRRPAGNGKQPPRGRPAAGRPTADRPTADRPAKAQAAKQAPGRRIVGRPARYWAGLRRRLSRLFGR